MSWLMKAPVGTSSHPVSIPLPPGLELSSTYLAPADPFPTALAELELVELLVLHSRITRQLDHEYCTDPAGAHPVTLDRAEELVAELDTREEFLAAPASPADRKAATTAPPSCTGDRPDTARTAAATPRQAGKHGDGPSRAGKKAPSDQTVHAAEPPLQDLGALRPGHQVEVWHHGHRQCVGAVEETAPSLGVVWIREGLDGYRRLVSTQEVELRRHVPGGRGEETR